MDAVATKIPTPYPLPSTVVQPDWIDHNGHMNVAYYLMAFDIASGGLLDFLGLGKDYRRETANGTFTGELHIRYRGEVKEGDLLRFTAQVIGCDSKRVHYWIEMYHETEGYLAATCELVTLHMDMTIRRVAPMPDDMVEWIEKVRDAHATLPRPDGLGNVIATKGNA